MSAVSPLPLSTRGFEMYDSIRVLILRRKARPTATELHIQYSNMINEALEMIAMEPDPGDTTESYIPSEQYDGEA